MSNTTKQKALQEALQDVKDKMYELVEAYEMDEDYVMIWSMEIERNIIEAESCLSDEDKEELFGV